MPRIEMLQAGLVWAEKELNGWAGDIEGEGEIGGSSEGVAHPPPGHCSVDPDGS